MKNIVLLAFFLVSTMTIGQTIQTSEGEVPSYEDRMFYDLQSDCTEGGELSNCWKLGMWWDEEASDYSLVSSSDVYLYYFPKSGLPCEGPKLYKLISGEGTTNENDEWLATWEYSDEDISIRFSMLPVESFFGYSSYDLQVTNHNNENCNGPATGTISFVE